MKTERRSRALIWVVLLASIGAWAWLDRAGENSHRHPPPGPRTDLEFLLSDAIFLTNRFEAPTWRLPTVAELANVYQAAERVMPTNGTAQILVREPGRPVTKREIQEFREGFEAWTGAGAGRRPETTALNLEIYTNRVLGGEVSFEKTYWSAALVRQELSFHNPGYAWVKGLQIDQLPAAPTRATPAEIVNLLRYNGNASANLIRQLKRRPVPPATASGTEIRPPLWTDFMAIPEAIEAGYCFALGIKTNQVNPELAKRGLPAIQFDSVAARAISLDQVWNTRIRVRPYDLNGVACLIYLLRFPDILIFPHTRFGIVLEQNPPGRVIATFRAKPSQWAMTLWQNPNQTNGQNQRISKLVSEKNKSLVRIEAEVVGWESTTTNSASLFEEARLSLP